MEWYLTKILILFHGKISYRLQIISVPEEIKLIVNKVQ